MFVYTLRKDGIRTRSVNGAAACVLIGFTLGLLSAFLGIGGGPINLAVLSFFFSMDSKTAALNSLYIILYSQAASFLNTLVRGTVPEFDWLVLIAMCVGGVLGGMLGPEHQRQAQQQGRGQALPGPDGRDNADKLLQSCEVLRLMDFEIGNGALTARVASRGAELKSLCFNGAEYIWQAGPEWGWERAGLLPLVRAAAALRAGRARLRRGAARLRARGGSTRSQRAAAIRWTSPWRSCPATATGPGPSPCWPPTAWTPTGWS